VILTSATLLSVALISRNLRSSSTYVFWFWTTSLSVLSLILFWTLTSSFPTNSFAFFINKNGFCILVLKPWFSLLLIVACHIDCLNCALVVVVSIIVCVYCFMTGRTCTFGKSYYRIIKHVLVFSLCKLLVLLTDCQTPSRSNKLLWSMFVFVFWKHNCWSPWMRWLNCEFVTIRTFPELMLNNPVLCTTGEIIPIPHFTCRT